MKNTSALITRMIKQGRNVGKRILKAYENHQLFVQKYGISKGDILRTEPQSVCVSQLMLQKI